MASSSKSKPFSPAGKSAIITGAGSGINFCFASLLLSKGCNVVFADLSLRPEAQQLVDEYAASGGNKPRAIFVKTDVSNWKALDHMFEVAEAEFDGVDLVCPGAGICDPEFSNFWHPPGSQASKDSPDGGHYKTLDINVTHPIRTTQLAISRYLYPRKGSKASPDNPKRVVLISSIAAQGASLDLPLYITSKHAISGFIRCMAKLEVLDIRVNGVAPAAILTPLWTDNPGRLKWIDGRQSQLGTPEEVAQALYASVTSEELPGGTILEVGKSYTRLISQYGDPGPPKGVGILNAAGTAPVKEKVLEWLAEDGWGMV